ncbi:MAG TPA: F0F1 ATP synthase subunit gamma [Actinobacteria bacterium]|nr:F0F1 ATP synthase subunit gamma [Actinomycetota bacterium]
MGAQLRVYRRRIRSVQATKKITRAMELIAASRIVKAQGRVEAARPYAEELRRAVSAAASQSGSVNHPLLAANDQAQRSAVLVVSADRGLAGAYSTNAIKEAEALSRLLVDEESQEVVNYLYGRKAVAFYSFRNRPVVDSWTGQTDAPTYEQARAMADALLEAYNRPTQDGGVDQIHIVYTRFINMGVQAAAALRILPLQVVQGSVESATGGAIALYDFEPSAEAVLDALLPQYVAQLIYSCLLESAASEHAARRRAMKSATDNAEELIKSLTRAANAARQAEITQEISEIVGGADALSAAAGSE